MVSIRSHRPVWSCVYAKNVSLVTGTGQGITVKVRARGRLYKLPTWRILECMTNEQLFDDLKQFIAASVSQQTADLTQRMDGIEANMATKDDFGTSRATPHREDRRSPTEHWR